MTSASNDPIGRLTGVCCAWCDGAFQPRATGGRRQRFCGDRCRRALDRAGRRWIADALDGGMLTVADLKSGPAATRTLLPAASSPSAAPEGPPALIAAEALGNLIAYLDPEVAIHFTPALLKMTIVKARVTVVLEANHNTLKIGGNLPGAR